MGSRVPVGKPISAQRLSRRGLHEITHARSSTAILEVGAARVVRIFIQSLKNYGSTWKTLQIPSPCAAEFCCDLLLMKPSVASIADESFRLVEVHGVTDIKVLQKDEDILPLIDSWPKDQLIQFKLVFKDPSKMKKIIRIHLQDGMMKTIAAGYDMTAHDIFSMLARKMKLVDTSQYRIILLTNSGEESEQRLVGHDERLFPLVSQLTQDRVQHTFYFRDPLTPIKQGDIEVISIPYIIPELPRFEVLSLLGQGGFGKVWKVRDLDTQEILALKVMRKFAVVEREMILHTNIELQMMKELVHPFIVNLYHSAQTEERLYMAMEYLEGGSLFDIIRTHDGPFSEEQSRFYGAQIILALEELHDKKFVYRDLKLENILLDKDGNLRLTDFGLSHFDPSGNGVKSFSGTAIYLAPEILQNTPHSKSVDFWCFGIAMFLLLCQEPPFWHENHKELFEEIKTKPPYWDEHPYLSAEASSLLHDLLEKDPTKRLGTESIDQVKEHAFFASIDWDAVLAKTVTPPHVPTVSSKNAVCIPVCSFFGLHQTSALTLTTEG